MLDEFATTFVSPLPAAGRGAGGEGFLRARIRFFTSSSIFFRQGSRSSAVT
jgi:hypothetical protein